MALSNEDDKMPPFKRFFRYAIKKLHYIPLDLLVKLNNAKRENHLCKKHLSLSVSPGFFVITMASPKSLAL
jgi:hypothetical protein